MGKKNDAELCNVLINTIRAISTRMHDDQLPTDIKDQIRPVFKECRTKAFTYHHHLQKDDSDLAVDGEPKIVQAMQEDIESCPDNELLEKIQNFDDYLDFCVDGLDPLEDQNLEDVDLDSLIVEVPS